MRILVSALLVLGWLAAAVAGEPKPITVAVGEEFTVSLPGNATTGYLWALSKPPDEKLVRVLKSGYKASTTKRVGAGGVATWTFKGLAEGKTQMQLDYARSWEKDVKPVQTTNFVVVVKAGKGNGKK